MDNATGSYGVDVVWPGTSQSAVGAFVDYAPRVTVEVPNYASRSGDEEVLGTGPPNDVLATKFATVWPLLGSRGYTLTTKQSYHCHQ